MTTAIFRLVNDYNSARWYSQEPCSAQSCPLGSMFIYLWLKLVSFWSTAGTVCRFCPAMLLGFSRWFLKVACALVSCCFVSPSWMPRGVGKAHLFQGEPLTIRSDYKWCTGHRWVSLVFASKLAGKLHGKICSRDTGFIGCSWCMFGHFFSPLGRLSFADSNILSTWWCPCCNMCVSKRTTSRSTLIAGVDEHVRSHSTWDLLFYLIFGHTDTTHPFQGHCSTVHRLRWTVLTAPTKSAPPKVRPWSWTRGAVL